MWVVNIVVALDIVEKGEGTKSRANDWNNDDPMWLLETSFQARAVNLNYYRVSLQQLPE
ncbi:MAG: hypothetical protein IIB95_11875 [Candidatus Marinimicrobia bacterium]|nr:hypothetical protein [Candidatus Neomarinimicrobiota bacterium]